MGMMAVVMMMMIVMMVIMMMVMMKLERYLNMQNKKKQTCIFVFQCCLSTAQPPSKAAWTPSGTTNRICFFNLSSP